MASPTPASGFSPDDARLIEITDLPPGLIGAATRTSFFAPGTFRPATLFGFARWMLFIGGGDPRGRVVAWGVFVFSGLLANGVLPNKYGPAWHLTGTAEMAARAVSLVMIAMTYAIWVELTTRPPSPLRSR